MTIVTGIVAFTIIWMLTLFVVLPFGVKTHSDMGEPTPLGHAESAPVTPRIGRKFLITSVIAITCFAIYWVIVEFDLIGKIHWFE